MKTRKQKAALYDAKYAEIPRDFQERLNYMYTKFKMNPSKADAVFHMRNLMIDSFHYSNELYIVLYEEPEGSPRPRARLITKNNLTTLAKSNPSHIQIYSLTGAADKAFFKRLQTDNEMFQVDQLICTPCIVRYEAYLHTPTSFNTMDTYMAELGIIRPITKPDFDNIEKKYSDMMTGNIWLDDALVVESSMSKYYSILPRVEIRLRFLNLLYNKYQYDSISKRLTDSSNVDYFKRE